MGNAPFSHSLGDRHCPAKGQGLGDACSAALSLTNRIQNG